LKILSHLVPLTHKVITRSMQTQPGVATAFGAKAITLQHHY
jgi:hypothetical protein